MPTTTPLAVQPSVQGRAYGALLAVCFFWGTTYLAIRMSLESFSPLQVLAIRFVCSGSLMLIGAKLAGARLPRGRELWTTAFTGILLLGCGNACLVFAETWIPSGLAALFITLSPFWMVGIEAALPGGERLRRMTLLGLLIGLAGTGLLVSSDLNGQGAAPLVVRGFLILQLGNFCWAAGSIYHRRQETRAHPIVSGAVQQLAAGLAFVPFVALIPQPALHPTFRSAAALAYLVVFGSIVGYSAYIYALSHLPIALVSLYSYVNPVVAVFLGWLFYREPFGMREMAAMAVIFAGVAIVKRVRRE